MDHINNIINIYIKASKWMRDNGSPTTHWDKFVIKALEPLEELFENSNKEDKEKIILILKATNIFKAKRLQEVD